MNIPQRTDLENVVRLDYTGEKFTYHCDGKRHIFNTESEMVESLAVRMNKTVPEIIGYLKQKTVYFDMRYVRGGISEVIIGGKKVG